MQPTYYLIDGISISEGSEVVLKWLLLLCVGTTRRLHNDADAIALDFGSFDHIGEAENVLAPRAEQIRIEADGIGCNVNPSTALVVRAGVVPNNCSDLPTENCADDLGRVDIRRGRQFRRCSATGVGARSAGHTTGGFHIILPVIRPAKI